MGRKRLICSLKTHDLKLAQARRYEALVVFERQIEAARRTPADTGYIDTALDLRASLERIEAGDPATIKAYWGHSGMASDPNAQPQVAAREMAEHSVETMVDHLRETQDDAAADAFAAVAYGRATPLLHHLELWLAEGGSKGAFRDRTKLQHRTDVKRLETWARSKGVPETVEAFTRKVAGRYVSDTIVAAGVHPVTGNRWLSAASAYWRWMMKRAGVETNPWSGQSLAKPAAHHDDEQRKRPFTDAEMVALLSGDPGQELADLIRVAALSGMRLEEVYRLTVADCASGWFNVRVSKTRAGRRQVPVHSGLAEIVARRCEGKGPGAFLFHEAGDTGTRERSAAVSKRFGRYRQAQGVHERAEDTRHSAVDFHSLRRWFVTTARNARQDRAVVAAIVGHEVGNLTDDVYHGGPDEGLRRACVEAVRLPATAKS